MRLRARLFIAIALAIWNLAGLVRGDGETLDLQACTLSDADAAQITFHVSTSLPGTLYVRPSVIGNWPPDLPAGNTVIVIPFDADGGVLVQYATEAGDVYEWVIRQTEISACLEPVAGDAPAVAIPVDGPGQYEIWFPDTYGTMTNSGVIVEAERKDGVWVAVIVLGDRALIGKTFEARRV